MKPESILLTLLAAVPLVATVSRSHAEEVKPAAPVTRDVFYRAGNGAIALKGGFDGLIRRGVEHQLKALDYTKLVDFFRKRANPFAAGEFWGKTVRAACLSYQYRPDPELKRILDATVADLLSAQTPDGCISTRSYPEQPKQSDLWDRKYVLLGLLGYYEINPDPKVLQAMVRLADYTLSQIGPAPKIRIVDTGWAFDGIESSSILEPIVKLYALTGFPRYLGFARYIVETEGACKRGSIFEAAFRGVAPKDINSNGNPKQSIAKAYESMSCFEGLLEYYRMTGNPHWKQAAVNYYNGIRNREITILGSGGGQGPYNAGPGDGEQWNDTAFEQSNPAPRRMMETCVTVTWMKFCYQILRLTGDPTAADEMERSMYNALAGAQRPSGDYYDYFQNFNGTRKTKAGFTYNIGGFPLSCCTANGPMGMALVPFAAFMNSASGPVINFYPAGNASLKTPSGGDVMLDLSTGYPKTGAVAITVTPKKQESFSLRLRIPSWSRNTALKINGKEQAVTSGTYAEIKRAWSAGDKVELVLDMRCRLIHAPRGSDRAGDHFQALIRGPIILARDVRLGEDIRQALDVQADPQGYVAVSAVAPTTDAGMEFVVPVAGGGSFHAVDYASAGNTWDARSEYRTWIPSAGAVR